MREESHSRDLSVSSRQHIEERDYWLARMSGEWIKSAFPYDDKEKKPAHLLKTDPREINIRIPHEWISRINALTKGYDYTLHMLLTAVVEVLLARYTGHSDIIVGVPIYKQESGEDVQFINTVLTLRNQLNPGITFKELLLQVRQILLEADKNQNYSIETLLYQLEIPFSPDTDDFPLFDVVVLLENIHDRCYIEDIPVHMLFSFKKTGQQVQGVLVYSPRYRSETARRIVNHFLHILHQLLENTRLKISDVKLLSKAEKEQLLTEFNNTASQYPRHKTIHELFAEQAGRTPHNTALHGENLSITYKELNQRSAGLAYLLKEKGVKSDTIAAIMVNRCPEMIVGILGILKAGAAYMPIDPDYPQERIRYMLADSSAKILLNDNAVEPGKSEIRISKSETNTNDQNKVSTPIVSNFEFRASNFNSSSLSYIIYTSGSTGRPKGVMIEHSSLHNLVIGLKQRIYHRYNQGLKVALLAPFVFDASVKQIFAALLLGHTLYIIPGNTPLDGDTLIDFYKKYTIDISDGTPTHLKLLLQCEKDISNIFLKHFIIGGEPLTRNIANALFNRFKQHVPKITNVYGPTECSVDSTSFEVTKTSLEILEEIPIGKPMPNHYIYILGKETRVQPIGVPGELYIAGHGVARGYLNNPGLTNEKFLLNRYYRSNRSHRSYFTHKSYLYRTGDLARWLADGNIQFIGRIDHQVKIRGHRIELGEIENRLIRHPAVVETAVIVKQDGNGDDFLCAYVVLAEPGEIIDGTQFRDYLSGTLPFYLVPSSIIPIGAIPCTSHGKVDRKALAAIESELPRQYVGPRDETEKKLTGVWSAVLKRTNEIGIDDNFFQLGGHSLTATILVSRIHKVFAVRVPLEKVFQTPTIREIARYIKNRANHETYISIKPVEEKEYYELSSAQRRLYYLQQLDLQSTSYNLVLICKLEGEIRREKFKEVFKRLIHRHEGLRTAFEVIGHQPRQRIYRGDEVEFEVEYGDMNEEESMEFEKSFITVFDLAQPPLLRVVLIKLKGADNQLKLLVNSHHIISDGTSQTILIKEFMALYSGQDLPLLRVRFRDFSQWQNSDMEKEFMKNQGHYWLKRFVDQVPVVNLPTDFQRPTRRNFEGERVSFTLERQETQQLKEIAAREDITLYTLLLSVYTVFIHKLTGQEDIVVGTPQSGRRHVDLEPLVGMFVNLLAMRNFPRKEKSFKQFLSEVKENTLQALQNQDYIFEELVKAVVKKSDPSRNPLFDTVFVVQNLDFPIEEIPGLKLLPYSYFDRVSKFDLALFTVESNRQLNVLVEYSTQLFQPKTIRRFIRNFKEVLAAVLENETIRLQDIPITHGLTSVESTVTDVGFDI